MNDVLKAVLATIIALAIIIVIYATVDNISKLYYAQYRGKIKCIEIFDSAKGQIIDINCYNVETGEDIN